MIDFEVRNVQSSVTRTDDFFLEIEMYGEPPISGPAAQGTFRISYDAAKKLTAALQLGVTRIAVEERLLDSYGPEAS